MSRNTPRNDWYNWIYEKAGYVNNRTKWIKQIMMIKYCSEPRIFSNFVSSFYCEEKTAKTWNKMFSLSIGGWNNTLKRDKYVGVAVKNRFLPGTLFFLVSFSEWFTWSPLMHHPAGVVSREQTSIVSAGPGGGQSQLLPLLPRPPRHIVSWHNYHWRRRGQICECLQGE